MSDYRRELDLTPYPRPQALFTAEEKSDACDRLLKYLVRERGLIVAYSADYARKRQLVRRYMNERGAYPVPGEILSLQDGLLWTESVERGIVDAADIPEQRKGIALWEGDIIRLNADAIVNAANSSLLGCFSPGHNCIDNVIHSAAGMQLRADCARIIACMGEEERTGDAKITRAYNLPSRYVLHTVGPMIAHGVKESDRLQLRSSYMSCLELAVEMGLKSVAFCCISTGVFGFPHGEAAEIAVGAVLNWKMQNPEREMKIIFNTFQKEDTAIYYDIFRHLD